MTLHLAMGVFSFSLLNFCLSDLQCRVLFEEVSAKIQPLKVSLMKNPGTFILVSVLFWFDLVMINFGS